MVRDRDLDANVKDGVDTLLLKLYTELNQTDELKLLASSPNSCVLVCISSIPCLDTVSALRWLSHYKTKRLVQS